MTFFDLADVFARLQIAGVAALSVTVVILFVRVYAEAQWRE